MKNNYYLLALFFFGNLMSFAQAVLPTSWSFTTTTLPTGWTTSGTAYYTASGNTPPALKFDGTGDLLTIYFADAPGNVTYYLAGNSFSGGTFLVEESVNGSTWTTLHSHTNPPAGAYTQYTDVPNSLTRYIRFNYSNKVSGNIGLDDVNIAAAAAGPTQEINVLFGGTSVVNGGTVISSSPVSTNTPITLVIQNNGTVNSLAIANVSISGTNAADFAVASAPTSVTANGSQNLVINFTPAAAGNRNAIITITNDDSDENPYVINIDGIGGSFATEPSAQATALVFSNVKTYRLTGNYAAASNVDGYLILRKKGGAITEVPVDGEVYERGDYIGVAQVVNAGDVTSFVPNNIVANTTYYFTVFSYNGTGQYTNYLITNPLTANVTTPATMQPANYYNGIDASATSFVTDLHNLINPHQEQFYSNYATKMVAGFESRDTVDNQRVVTCVYSGENKVYTEPFDFTAYGFSREHTYCHSWMPTNPAQALPEYNDYHHLFPTNMNDANGVRSNYPLGVVQNVTSTYLGAKFGTDVNGNTVYEPRDEHKGDAARALFYEAVCYNSVSGNNWSLPASQNQTILKQWHFEDLPDNWEIARNDYIDSLQDNRNPFIDSIDFVCYVDFSTMNYYAAGCGTESLNELLLKNFGVFPVPAKEKLFAQVNGTIITDFSFVDMQGREVLSGRGMEQKVISLSIANCLPGVYLLEVETPHGSVSKKVIVE